jgi:hypothetical protein
MALTPESQRALMAMLKVKQPESIAAPIQPKIGTNPLTEAYYNYIEGDPLAQQVSGGDPLKKLLRFASEFVPGINTELAQRRGDKVGEALSYLDALGAASVPAKAVAKGAEKAADFTKDMMFLHNTSQAALKNYESLGGIPSPSIAVTQKDIPFTGFGDITLVGNPKNFNPNNLKNKIYSSDAYTPRSPAPFRLADKDAYKRLEDDYKDIANKYEIKMSNIVDDMYEQSFKKNAANSYGNSDINRFFDYEVAPKIKFLQEKGINVEPVYKGGMELEIRPYTFRDKTPMLGLFNKKTGEKIYSETNTEFNRDLLERTKESNEKISIDSFATKKKIDKELDKFNSSDYENWVVNEKNKYLQDDLFFKSGGYFDNPKTKEYSLDNLVNYMKKQPQIGGEGDGIGTKGIGRLKAALTGKFKSLDEIKQSKSQIIDKEKAKDVYEKTENEFFDIANNLYDSLPNQSSYNQFSFIDDVSDLIFDAIQKGGGKKEIKESFDVYNISNQQVNKIQKFLKNLEKAPVGYFEAKPTRAVGLDEFSGAIVPEATPKETLDLLKSYGINIEKYDPFIEPSRTQARDKFQNQMFNYVLPAPLLAGAIATQDKE